MGKGINGYVKRTFSKFKKSKIKMENKNIGKGKSGVQSPFKVHRGQAQPNTKDGTVNAIYVEGNEIDKSIREEENDQGWIGGTPEYEYTDELPRNLRSSHRFFAGPVLSDSLMEEARLSVSSSVAQAQVVASNNSRMSVAVDSVAEITYSNDPYEDFRQSMVDMLNARHDGDDPSQPLDWDFIEQLLFCYLKLNDREVHKYIFGAFSDLTETGRQMLRID